MSPSFLLFWLCVVALFVVVFLVAFAPLWSKNMPLKKENVNLGLPTDHATDVCDSHLNTEVETKNSIQHQKKQSFLFFYMSVFVLSVATITIYKHTRYPKLEATWQVFHENKMLAHNLLENKVAFSESNTLLQVLKNDTEREQLISSMIYATQQSGKATQWSRLGDFLKTLPVNSKVAEQQAVMAYENAHFKAPKNVKLTMQYVNSSFILNGGKLTQRASHSLRYLLEKNPMHEGAHLLLILDALAKNNQRKAKKQLDKLTQILLKKGNRSDSVKRIMQLKSVLEKNNNS